MRASESPQGGRRSADRDAFRVSLADGLRPLSDPAAIQDTAAELLGRYIGANRAYYGEIDDEAKYLLVRRDYSVGVRSLTGHYPVNVFGRALVGALESGQTLVVQNSHEHPALSDAEREAYVALGAVALLAVPIVTEERWSAVLTVAQNQPRVWTPDEIALVEETGARTVAAAERARAVSALRASEQRFRTLFESIDEGIALVELLRDGSGAAVDFRILTANERCLELDRSQSDPSEPLLFTREPSWLGTFDSVARSGEAARFERYVPELQRWFRAHVSPATREGADRLLVALDDVTETRLAESARRSAQKRQSYLLSLSDAIRPLADPVAIQRTACDCLGRHLGVERAYYCEVAPDDRHLVIRYEYCRGVRSLEGSWRIADYGVSWSESLRRGHPLVVADTQASSQLGTAERAKYAAVQMRGILAVPLVKDDRWLGCLAVASAQPREWSADDATVVQETAERTWAAIERSLSEQALRDAHRRKDEFLAMLAHELRNPLAPILNSAHVLDVTNDEAQIREASAMVQRQVKHMVRLVDDLLDVSRISRGQLELRMARVELSAVVQQAVERIWPLVERNNLDLAVTIPPRPIFLNGDPARLAQVVDNLLHNAVKFTNHSGRIQLNLMRYGNQGIIQVRDNGIGISSDHLPAIFEMFMQGDKSLERATGGLGLGLTLVKRLAELHGGSVDARSDGPGAGSEFTVRLPVLPEAAPVAPVQKASPAPAVRPLRILVVDDSRDGAESLAMLLQWGGHETRIAYDGLHALEVARGFRPEVTMLDIGLPKLNGYDTCRRMREERWGRDSVMVALTGWADDEHRRRSREAGFDHHVVKPVSAEALGKILESVAGPGPG